MDRNRNLKPRCFFFLLLLGTCPAGGLRAAAPQEKRSRGLPTPVSPVSPSAIPDDIQLVNANVNPTIRIPVNHSSLNWTLIKPRLKASFGWLEIDQRSARYILSRQSHIYKELDEGFDFSRSAISNITFEYSAAEFRAGGLRHFFGYSPPAHWDVVDSKNGAQNVAAQADGAYTPIILRALQNFDSVVEELRLRQQAEAPPPVVVQPVQPAPPKPAPLPPPTLVIVTPSGAAENQTLDVNSSPLTLRGVAMDNAGLPTVSINGKLAALRPKSDNIAEFWSDPINLKPGDNSIEIVATSPAKASSHFKFVAHFRPSPPPVNPRALDKAEILSLLEGGVSPARVAELVGSRGLKFAPTAADLDDIRAAGGSDDLIQAIQRTAATAPPNPPSQ